jgi:hypothetical protein
VVSGDARLLRSLGTANLILVWVDPTSHCTIMTHTARAWPGSWRGDPRHLAKGVTG